MDGKTSFEVPLNNVSHSTTGKNEVTLEFHQNDEVSVALMELRFHIPSNADAEKDNVEVRMMYNICSLKIFQCDQSKSTV